MTCHEWELEILADVHGEISPQRREEVRAHLSTCAACRSWAASVTRDAQVLTRLVPPPSPADSFQSVHITIEKKKSHRRWLAAVAAAALIAVGVGLLLRPTPRYFQVVVVDEVRPPDSFDWNHLSVDHALAGGGLAILPDEPQ